MRIRSRLTYAFSSCVALTAIVSACTLPTLNQAASTTSPDAGSTNNSTDNGAGDASVISLDAKAPENSHGGEGGAASNDAGTLDSGPVDAGPPPPPIDASVDSGAVDSGSVDSGSMDSGKDAGPIGHGKVSGKITDFQTSKPVAGASVCVVDSSSIPCGTVQSDGSFEVAGLPQDQDIVLLAKANGYIGATFSIHTPPKDPLAIGEWNLMDGGTAFGFAQILGVTVDVSKGGVFVGALDDVNNDFMPNVKATLSPMSGQLYYLNHEWIAEKDLTSTSASGQIGAFNVVPSSERVNISVRMSTSVACIPGSFWTKTSDGLSIAARIVPGAFAYGDFHCASSTAP